MKIQRASSKDFPHLYALADEFNTAHYHVTLDRALVREWFSKMLQDGVLYFTDSGFIGGIVLNDPVRQWTCLYEHAWYAKDRSGVALLRRFIEFGKDNYVDEIRMTTLPTTPPAATRVLLRHGFREVERCHALTLTQD